MTGFDLGQVGYTLEEFFLESTATRFEPAGPAAADGYWEVTPAGQAPFTTRLVVCRLGSTRVFDAAELARRYPAGPDEYAAAFRQATTRAADAGFVLEQDVEEIVAVAAAAYPA
jgi:hypothetical protein